jgi:hypothetical protein
VNDLHRSILERISAAGPIVLHEDWQDLRDIERLCERSSLTDKPGRLALIEEPCISILGVTFHRLTIGANSFASRARSMFTSVPMQNLVYAFTLAHARTPRESLWPLIGSKDKLTAALKEWKSNLGLTHEEVARALAYFEDFESSRDEGGEAPDYGMTLESLIRNYGQTMEYWVWDCPLDDITLAVDSGSRINAEAARDAGGRTDPDRRDVRAHRHLMKAVRALEAKVKGRASP